MHAMSLSSVLINAGNPVNVPLCTVLELQIMLTILLIVLLKEQSILLKHECAWTVVATMVAFSPNNTNLTYTY